LSQLLSAESESYVTTDGQSASLSWYKAPIRGLRPDFFPFGIWNASDSYDLDSVGRPLWREDGSVFCMCRWSLPAQSFSGPSPLGLATVYYCLRFETSLFVASYDSQGHDGGIRPRLHTGLFLLSAALGSSLYSLRADPTENTVFIVTASIVACIFVAAGTCLTSCCLTINVYSGSTIPAFRRRVTILSITKLDRTTKTLCFYFRFQGDAPIAWKVIKSTHARAV
jgi:hypothetical protein